MLNPIQEDALKEHMNQYIGQGASLLSEMLNKRINLTIPDIFLLSPKEDKEKYYKFKPEILKSHVVSSSIKFGSDFSGKAQLLFPKDKSQTLVRLCLGEIEEYQISDTLTDADFDAIREIGNVILNTIIGSLANLLALKVDYTIPEVHVSYFPEEEKGIFLNKESYFLIICNTFAVDEVNVDGAIIVVLNVESIMELIKKIDEVLVDVYE